MNVARVAVSQTKGIEKGLNGVEMSLMYSKVYIKTVFAITEMSCDKLFHAGNGHTSF